jgi:hypothetical protein
MPAEYLKCVRALRAKGKSKADAQRICAISYHKKHGRTPQQDERQELSAMALIEQLKQRLIAAQEQGDTGEIAQLHRQMRTALRTGEVKIAELTEEHVAELVEAGVLAVFRGASGDTTAVPLDTGKEVLAEYIEGEVEGSLEATIKDIQQAVSENKRLFGIGPDDFMGAWVEATFDNAVIVRAGSNQLWRATWHRPQEGGPIAFRDVEEVELVVRTGKGARTVTVEHDRANEMLEVFVGPVRIITEKDVPTPTGTDHLMTVECVLGQADTPTKNGRVYPRGLFESLVSESAEGTDRSRRWLGEADHPPDGYPRITETVSTPWRDLRLDSDKLLGTTDIIDTTRGADVQKLIRNGVPVQVSSRCFGRTTTRTVEGAVQHVVDADAALDGWGGWDFVFGAANSEATVATYSESTGTPAATGDNAVSGTESGESIDEALRDMTAEQLKELLEKQNKEVAATITSTIGPLLEKIQGGGEPAGEATKEKEGEVEAEGGKQAEATPAVADIVAAVEAMGEKLVTHLDAQQEDREKKIANETALTQGRAAVMETEAVKSWPEPARKLLEKNLQGLTDAADIAPTFKSTQDTLQEIGMLVIASPSGGGRILDTSDPAVAAGVQTGTVAAKDDKEKHVEWRRGLLKPEHAPRTPEELLDLATACEEDTGAHMQDMVPTSPVLEWLRKDGALFEGYHPGNPRHVLRALLMNTVKNDPRTMMPHLQEYAQEPLFRALMEWTGTGDVVNSTPFILPLITQTWPKIFARELCSVQPMNMPTGRVHYLDFLYDPSGADPSQMSDWVSDYGNNISEQAAIPQMKLQIVGYDIGTDTKKLHAEWSTEAMQDLRAEHGIDIAGVMLSAMSDEIAREINAFLLNQMLLAADPHYAVVTAGNQNYGTQVPAAAVWPNGTLAEWRKEIYTAIISADLNVQNARYRPTNWIVCSPTAMSYISRLESWRAWTANDEAREWNVGINRVGTIESAPGWAIYVSQHIAQNTMLLGRKGSDWPDAGMVYAPYIPIYTSPILTEPSTLCNREAVMSRFGFQKVIGNMFATVTLQPGVAGVPLV